MASKVARAVGLVLSGSEHLDLVDKMGCRRNGINWKLIEVINNKKGQPFIKLHGKAKETLDGLIPKNMIPKVFISLTDEKELAQAIVIIEAIRKDTI